MSYYGKSSKTDWSKHSNGLNKSSSQPYYYNPPELNTYKSTYLPLIKFNQQAEILSNKIDKSNRIKDQILNSRYKFLNNRGIENNYRNKYKDSLVVNQYIDYYLCGNKNVFDDYVKTLKK